tara:strand:+ start:199 stop:639 length:441 start_codon:yes stop_codon:yes gene_type:complete
MNKGIMSGMAPVRMQEGGEAGTKYFGEDGLIFDPYNPLDWAMGIPGLGQVGMGIKALSTGNKLRKINKAANAASKLSNPVTNTAGATAFTYIVGDAIKDFITEDYTDPSVAYLNEDTGDYYYYDPEKNDYDYFENNQVPEGYTLEQ